MKLSDRAQKKYLDLRPSGKARAGMQQETHRHGEEPPAPEALYPPGSPQFKAQKQRLPRRPKQRRRTPYQNPNDPNARSVM